MRKHACMQCSLSTMYALEYMRYIFKCTLSCIYSYVQSTVSISKVHTHSYSHTHPLDHTGRWQALMYVSAYTVVSMH